MKVVLDHTEEVAPNTKTFWFRALPKLDYIAGQFIEMTLPHENADSRGQKRWFTLSSSPTEQLISITTKKAVDRMSSFKKMLFGLEPGAMVTISEPMGDFVLPKDMGIPLLFVVGGIGVTPVRSIIKWLVDNHQQRNIHIVYGANRFEDVAFKGLFDMYRLDLDILLSNPPSDWHDGKGYLNAELILKLNTSVSPLIYISGPEKMVENLEAEFLRKKISPNRLILDFYPGYNASL